MSNLKLPVDDTGLCPACGKSWDDGLIVDRFKQMREKGEGYVGLTDNEIENIVIACYGDLNQHFSNLVGIETPEYDGISFWQCPFCKTEWNRWSGKKVEK